MKHARLSEILFNVTNINYLFSINTNPAAVAAVTPRLTEILKEHSELNGHTRPAHTDFILIFNDHAIWSGVPKS